MGMRHAKKLTRCAGNSNLKKAYIVRKFVQEQLAQRTHGQSTRRQLIGLEQVRAHRHLIQMRLSAAPNLPDLVEVIDQLREERNAELSSLPDRD